MADWREPDNRVDMRGSRASRAANCGTICCWAEMPSVGPMMINVRPVFWVILFRVRLWSVLSVLIRVDPWFVLSVLIRVDPWFV